MRPLSRATQGRGTRASFGRVRVAIAMPCRVLTPSPSLSPSLSPSHPRCHAAVWPRPRHPRPGHPRSRAAVWCDTGSRAVDDSHAVKGFACPWPAPRPTRCGLGRWTRACMSRTATNACAQRQPPAASRLGSPVCLSSSSTPAHGLISPSAPKYALAAPPCKSRCHPCCPRPGRLTAHGSLTSDWLLSGAPALTRHAARPRRHSRRQLPRRPPLRRHPPALAAPAASTSSCPPSREPSLPLQPRRAAPPSCPPTWS